MALQIERQVLVVGVVADHLVVGLKLRLDGHHEVLDRTALIKERQTAVEDDQKEGCGESQCGKRRWKILSREKGCCKCAEKQNHALHEHVGSYLHQIRIEVQRSGWDCCFI